MWYLLLLVVIFRNFVCCVFAHIYVVFALNNFVQLFFVCVCLLTMHPQSLTDLCSLDYDRALSVRIHNSFIMQSSARIICLLNY